MYPMYGKKNLQKGPIKVGAKEAKLSRSFGWTLTISSLSSYPSTAWGETLLFIFYFGILLAYGGWWFGEGTLGTICFVLWQVSSATVKFSFGAEVLVIGFSSCVMCFTLNEACFPRFEWHRIDLITTTSSKMITFQPGPGLGWFSGRNLIYPSTFYRQQIIGKGLAEPHLYKQISL